MSQYLDIRYESLRFLQHEALDVGNACTDFTRNE